MAAYTGSIRLATQGFCDIHDLTGRVEKIVGESGIRNGIVTVFVPGATAGVTTIEYEGGAVADLKRAIERLAPEREHYQHDARWGDGNGFAHVRAALLGPSLSIPLAQETLQLGTWQQIILVDFDNRPRHRDVVVQIVGEQ
jgi:secondary thiamine-phosphate synthase enzyme